MTRRRSGIVLGALAFAGALAPIAAPAQTPAPRLPPSVEPRPAQPPRATTAPRTDFEFSINTPRTEREIDATLSPRFAVRDIVIDGATIFGRDDLKPLFEGLLGREASLAEIAGVATQIERRYRAAGYLLAQAFVPRQRVRDQVFQIKVVEGAIANVLVEGAVDESLRGHLVKLMAPITAQRPITQDVLMRALMLANDLPGVTATGVLRAAVDEPGAADLLLAVEVRDQSYALSVGNRGTRFQGPWSASSSAVFNGLLGRTEQIAVALTATP
ncbi:MAG: POTRA domain-containing protein, partial [Elsteraceae bacterium]